MRHQKTSQKSKDNKQYHKASNKTANDIKKSKNNKKRQKTSNSIMKHQAT